MAQWSKAKSHIVYIVTLKTRNWQELPWLLCILGHLNEDTARRGAVDIIKKFNSQRDQCKHRLSRAVCSPDTAIGR